MRARIRKLLFIGSALLLASGPAAIAADVAIPAHHDLSGVWWVEHYNPALTPTDGSPVPYNADGKAAHDRNLAAMAAGTLDDPAINICLLQGLPRGMISAYPIKIVQHDRTVTVIHEQNHAFWHAIMNIPHEKGDDIEPAFMGGDSVASWDGDTLVIDTIGFKERSFLDDEGMPHTDMLHLVQRLRKIDRGTRLEDAMTIEDPGVFTKPWTATRTYEWRPDVKIMEYVCGDPHRSLTGDRAQAVHLPRKPS